MSRTRIAPSKILPKADMSCHLIILPWLDGDKDQYVLYLHVPRRSEYGSSQPEGSHGFHI